MAQTCPKCGAAVGADDRFCGACGSALAPVAPAAPAPDVVAEGTESALSQTRNLARIAQVVALLGFVLPWITVSCQGRILAQVSGLDMALGRVTIRNPFTDVTQVHNGSPNAAVVVALVVIVAGLALSFNVFGSRSALANAAGSVAALVLVGYEVLVSAGSAVRSHAASSEAASGFERSLSEAIRVGTGFGFWLTCLALGAAAYLYWRLGTRTGRRTDSPPPPPPPPVEPRTNAPTPPG